MPHELPEPGTPERVYMEQSFNAIQEDRREEQDRGAGGGRRGGRGL